MEQWKFSTILYVDNEGTLEAALQNLASNTLFPQVQVIVVDPQCSDEVRALCEGKENVFYVAAEDAAVARAYNLGLERAKGEIINFTLASASYSPEIYQTVSNAFELAADEEIRMVSAEPTMLDIAGEKTHYAGAAKISPNNPIDVVVLEEQCARFQLALQAYFIQASVLKKHRFDEQLFGDATYQMVLALLMQERRYCFAVGAEYIYTVALEDKFSPCQFAQQSWWYVPSLQNFLIPTLKHAKKQNADIPKFLQKACYYLLYAKFDCNLNDRSKGVMQSKEEVDTFNDLTAELLSYLDNNVIMERKIIGTYAANRAVRGYFMWLKAKYQNKDLHIIDDGAFFTSILERVGDTVDDDFHNRFVRMARTNKEAFRIRLMNYEHGKLVIEANVGLSDILFPNSYQVFAEVTNETTGEVTVYDAEVLEVYHLVKCFGYAIMSKCPVRFSIPVKKPQSVRFFFCFDGRKHYFSVNCEGPYSRLTNKVKYSYWMFHDNWMLSWKKGDALMMRPVTKLFHMKRELLLCRELYAKDKDKKRARRGIQLRLTYWKRRKELSNRHVWVTFDKLYKAGDNGEYIYQYCRKNVKDVDMYYIINPEAPEYERMVREDKEHILIQDDINCQVTTLLAEAILATQASVSIRYDNKNEMLLYNKDLRRGRICCIQHGLTIQKIAQYQNRRFDDTQLYCLASPFELENLSHPAYGYTPDQLKMTGLARYDGLVNNDQKVILITPTWRRNVTVASVGNIRRPHNDAFKESTYFKVYNSLINNPKLIECAKRTGYRIVYLLHPVMSGQIDDFDRNDYVELLPATGDVSYEKILCESSLMVTDYSGVQFDFAYMRKPIVYYHPTELPAHYGDGGMDYETMGFGPICTGHDEVVDAICDAMERQCTTEQKYIDRADSFFAYSDHDSCKRIYEEVKQWMSTIEW